MSKKFLVPREGIKVRDPITGIHLPAEGASRQLNTYYNRRIKDGDLLIREPGKVSKPAEKKEKESK